MGGEPIQGVGCARPYRREFDDLQWFQYCNADTSGILRMFGSRW
jgi:hypothetical protein